MTSSEPGRALAVADGAVSTVTISNPAKRNALDDATRRSLLHVLRSTTADPECHVVVLRGDGATFCAGGELASMPTTDTAAIAVRMGELHDILRTILNSRQIFVAAVEGYAFGSGLSLVSACDHVVAAADAKFCASFAKVGVVADVGLLWTLPRRLGTGRALEVALFAATHGAHDTVLNGLIDAVVEPGTAVAGATARARQLAAGAPLALAAAKRLARRTVELEPFLADELAAQRTLLGTADFDEGRRAFFERRPPRFNGA